MYKKYFNFVLKRNRLLVSEYMNEFYFKRLNNGTYIKVQGEWYWVKKPDGKYCQIPGAWHWEKRPDGKYHQVAN